MGINQSKIARYFMKERFCQILKPFRINSDQKPRLSLFVSSMVLFRLVLGYCIYYGFLWLTNHTPQYNNLPASFYSLFKPVKYLLIYVLVLPILETFGLQALPIEFSRIRRIRIWLMILISSTIFVLAHIIGYHAYSIRLAFLETINHLPGGLILAYSYLRFRQYSSFRAFGITALIHGLYNSTLYLSALFFVWFIASDISPIGAKKVLEITYNQHNEKLFLFCAEKGYNNAVKAYLAEGMNPNTEDENGNVLMNAAYSGSSSVIITLLENGADINAKNSLGYTALMIAAYKGNLTSINTLLDKGAEINAVNKEVETALLLASNEGQADAVKVLLDRGANINVKDKRGRTAFIRASAFGHISTVKFLLDKGVDINASDNRKITALMYAAGMGQETTVLFLLDHGAKLDARDESGGIALHYAASRGHVATVRLLLDRGASINDMNKNKETALVFAVEKGYPKVAKLLIERGANVNIKNQHGSTILDFANKNPEIIKLLKQAGAKE
jgi:ankyrin repeat protein